jgi:hypothetical protein
MNIKTVILSSRKSFRCKNEIKGDKFRNLHRFKKCQCQDFLRMTEKMVKFQIPPCAENLTEVVGKLSSFKTKFDLKVCHSR